MIACQDYREACLNWMLFKEDRKSKDHVAYRVDDTYLSMTKKRQGWAMRIAWIGQDIAAAQL
jgi:hypothetical protein